MKAMNAINAQKFTHNNTVLNFNGRTIRELPEMLRRVIREALIA